MNVFDRGLVSLLVLLFPWVAGCNKADENALGGAGQRTPAASVSAIASANAVSASSEKDAEPDDAAVTEIGPGDGGTWIASDIYDLKVESAKYCSKPAAKGDAGEAKPGTVWLGVKVQILAKSDEVFLDRRHATLRDKGIYFQASLDPGPFGGCAPVFKPAQLKRTQVASGYIVFELPNAWPNLVFEFQPVRWGGAGRVRVKLPDPGKAP
jgi:hypothetical protein